MGYFNQGWGQLNCEIGTKKSKGVGFGQNYGRGYWLSADSLPKSLNLNFRAQREGCMQIAPNP